MEPFCDTEKYHSLSFTIFFGFLLLRGMVGEGAWQRGVEFGRTGLGTGVYTTWRGEGTEGEWGCSLGGGSGGGGGLKIQLLPPSPVPHPQWAPPPVFTVSWWEVPSGMLG